MNYFSWSGKRVLIFFGTLLVWFIIFLVLTSGGVIDIYGGGAGYDTIAKNIVDEGLYSKNGNDFTAFRPPIYPLAISAFMVICGSSWQFYIIVFQIILGSFCAVFIYDISESINENKTASYLSVSLLVFNPFVFRSFFAVKETALFTFLVVSSFWFIKSEKWTYRKVLVLSILAGLSQLTRPTGILLILLFVFVFYLDSEVKYAKVSLFFSVLVISLMPWYILVYSNTEYRGISSSTTGGSNLYKGNNPIALSTYPWVDVDKQNRYINNMVNKNNIDSESQRNTFLRRKALKYISSNPLPFLDLFLRKFIAFYSPLHVPLGSGKISKKGDRYYVNNFKSLSTLTNLSSYFSLVLIFSFVGYNFYVTYGIINPTYIELYIIIILSIFTALHCLTFAETRFRVPLDPLLSILAARFLYPFALSFMKRTCWSSHWSP